MLNKAKAANITANSTQNTPPFCADVGTILIKFFASTEVTLILGWFRTDWPLQGQSVIAGAVKLLQLSLSL